MTYILAIDQGTTSTRAIVFGADYQALAQAQQEFPQHFPANGWVEHDPNDLWTTTLTTCRDAIAKAGIDASQIAGIGITNQRETTLLWDKTTGQPLHNAIVWQDRRTANLCRKLERDGHGPMISDRTGLLLDPYFSATKLRWLLDHVDGARDKAAAGQLAFGTVDTWLIWNLTGGRAHVTDATNAARTMLYDIRKGRWSRTISDLLEIPMTVLPKVQDCAGDFGTTDPALFGGAIPILGVAGDQQAATVGQACFAPGMMKSTYGTGCFALLNTGEAPVVSENRLLTTIAYQLDGKPTYALEGSIFVAGAVVQWLRDGLKLISSAGETQPLAERADPSQNVILVPAFTGLGAPYWNADCRGAVFGLTRNSGPAEFARAALESVGYQTRDLLEAMQADWGAEMSNRVLRVDGGMANSDYAMQFLSDILNAPVDRPKVTETTALGAAWLAGHRAGVWPDQDAFAESWALERSFAPSMPEDQRDTKYQAWQRAVQATLAV
ncbi:glycerol kinase GlpK [Pseudoprimorskyibacter insulae]|uniref:Glycerol kinase n=1 Tax=Pseudoprimorskyibacter insulae TaxID=1695997 RepID=A0A2R8AUJ7_9RHOB|nr:glycerol kinase GlpK [Pseudoprimorskyibacter insulae]SPF79549.1 Glycerol kinase [Pseudoprimorskyibacter insulae]